MRIVINKYGLDFLMKENQPVELILESPTIFSDITNFFYEAVIENSSEVSILEGEKTLTPSKCMEVVINPYSINCNDKKIINKLYQEMTQMVRENLIDLTGNVNSVIVNYLDELINMMPYNIDYDMDLDISGILKLYGVKIQVEGCSLVERLIEYLKNLKRILGITLFVGVNFKLFFSEEEINQIYEVAAYEKIYIIIISGIHSWNSTREKCFIIDKDYCNIEI